MLQLNIKYNKTYKVWFVSIRQNTNRMIYKTQYTEKDANLYSNVVILLEGLKSSLFETKLLTMFRNNNRLVLNDKLVNLKSFLLESV